MNETDLIKGCIAEDRECQRLLYRQYSGKMFAVCLRYAGSRMEAEDMLQDAFIKVFDHINQFNHQGSFEGWIRKIVINTALAHLRKMKLLIAEQLSERHASAFEYLPGEDAISRISAKEIQVFISELPVGYRVVFNLYVVDGFSHQEIAQQLNISESTSRSQLTKARLMLRKKIVSQYPSYHGQYGKV